MTYSNERDSDTSDEFGEWFDSINSDEEESSNEISPEVQEFLDELNEQINNNQS